jgi:hypothetical protein
MAYTLHDQKTALLQTLGTIQRVTYIIQYHLKPFSNFLYSYFGDLSMLKNLCYL